MKSVLNVDALTFLFVPPGFFSAFKDKIIKWRNPDATVAIEGDSMQAYYDKEKKVWVFPGEDPDELARPIGPPPVSTPKAPEPERPKNNDPLSALMAPPVRPPSSLRPQPSTGKKSAASPGGPAPLALNFQVFVPKPATEAGSDSKEDSTPTNQS